MQDGLTALMEACIKGHVEIAEILVKHGAHKGLKDANGRSAMVRFRQDSSPKVFFAALSRRSFCFPEQDLAKKYHEGAKLHEIGKILGHPGSCVIS